MFVEAKARNRLALHIPVLHHHLKDAHWQKSNAFVADIKDENMTAERKVA